jgi:glutamate-1-semialdehyde aminotransferase
MLQIFISPNNIDFFKPDKRFNKIIELFYLALINHNILLSLPTSNHIYLSFMHTNRDINSILSISKYVLNYYNFNKLDFDNIQD